MVLEIPYYLQLSSIITFFVGIAAIFIIEGLFLFPILAVGCITMIFGGIFQLFTDLKEDRELTRNKDLQKLGKWVRIAMGLALLISVIVPGLALLILGLTSLFVLGSLFYFHFENQEDQLIARTIQVMIISPIFIPVIGSLVFYIIDLFGIPETTTIGLFLDFGLISITFVTVPLVYMIGIKFIQNHFNGLKSTSSLKPSKNTKS